MKFLGTRVIGNDINSQYVVADVVSDGAVLAHSVNVDEYITNLLKQIDALKAEVKNLDEGAKLLHSVAMNGEQSVLSRLDNGVDAVDAQRWQDAPEPYVARKVTVPQKLRSYASYNNTGKAQTLKAEEVDGERLGE